MPGHKTLGTDRNNLGVSPRWWYILYGTEALKGKVFSTQAQGAAVLPHPEPPRSPGRGSQDMTMAQPGAAGSNASSVLPQSTNANSSTK